MPATDEDNELSLASTLLIEAIIKSAPVIPDLPEVGPEQVVDYLSGVMDSEDAASLEAAAVENAKLRGAMGEAVGVLDEFQKVPFLQLMEAAPAEPARREAWSAWIEIVKGHIETVCGSMRGLERTSWTALAEMSRQGFEGQLAARTIWNALVSARPPGGGRALGYGYRRGSRGSLDSSRIVTQLEGRVLANGDLEIIAATELGPREGNIFFSFSVNGRSLPLAETRIVDSRAFLAMAGMGSFLRLAEGAVPAGALSAQVDDWPRESRPGNVIVDADPLLNPPLSAPIIRDGYLELTGYFENPQMEGVWELLLAVTPNSWQKLAQFDIKCTIERPQVLLAGMPSEAVEGSFGGALLLRRIGSQVA